MNKFFSIIFAVVFAICIYGAYSPAQASAAGLGSVNMSEVIANYPDMQTTNAAVDLARQKAQNEFNEKSASLDDKGKKDLFDKLNQQVTEQQNKLFQPIRDNISKAVDATAKEKGLDAVLDSSVVFYGTVDVTQDVIAKLKA
ncbi:OmpH family outer membrane protein [Pectinatus cerevisiiphilus]|uniref:Periplasmic chaperone for outer membrane proteins Skp n=1 Tax=Pectinatus cerevisiiphilus TaxID=86956 RepID=A0A4R3KE07_9FIRM|nr:OmpH family outer membrane protein [Pectinatus cerevisiiphilus]TCS81418.1 periplasmic chaperone for outer membrane proteins Skp [Pectinatus cerevisiiphilus]